MPRSTLLSLALVAALGALPAQAATPINQSRPLAATGTLHIENIKGRIVVRTWAQPEVKVTGSLGKGVEKLIFEGDASSARIIVKYPDSHDGNWGWGKGGSGEDSEPTILEVTMPQRASLDIDSVSASVDVQQMAGRELSVSSVSGDVVATASSPGEASFENVSGDTTLRITTARSDVESVSGDINLSGGITGDVSLESVSGNILLAAKALDKLHVGTVSGDADLRAGIAGSGQVKAETVSGNLRLTVPVGTSARIEAESFSGDIESPAGRVEHEEYGPGKSLGAKLGSGQGRIELESFSGDLRIRLE